MASKNSEPLESAITAKILKNLRAKGGWWQKNHGSPYTANLPDIIGCYHGRFVAFEVKRPSTRGSVTPGQEANLKAINDAGGFAFVVASVDEVEHCMGEYL